MTENTTTTTETAAAPAPDFQPITLASQAELDDFIGGRVQKAKAAEAKKYPDYDVLKAKAAELDSIKQASMTQTEKDAARIRELEHEIVNRDAALAAERSAGVRREVAAAKGVPPDRITGDTREELEKSADELLEWQKTAMTKTRPPVGALKSGASNTDPRMDKKERAAAMLRELYHK